MPLILISFITLCLSFPKIYQTLTEPLHPFFWKFIHPFEKNWQPQETHPEIETILSQPFFYLGRGLQFDCFQSKNGNYVIKLFRHTKSVQKMFDTICSTKLTFDHLQSETGLIWVHLNLKKGNPISLHDKLGRKFEIDPEIHRFILQKKITPLTPTLLKTIFAADLVHGQRLISSYFQLLDTMAEKGILNHGVRFFDNFGINQGQVFQIDIGKNIYQPQKAKTRAHSFKRSIQKWLSKNIDLISYTETKAREKAD